MLVGVWLVRKLARDDFASSFKIFELLGAGEMFVDVKVNGFTVGGR